MEKSHRPESSSPNHAVYGATQHPANNPRRTAASRIRITKDRCLEAFRRGSTGTQPPMHRSRL